MELQINRTQDGVLSYPLHKHNHYEVMLYLQGNGVLRTPDADYPFAPGTILLVPPGVEHGSVSAKGFCNISVSGLFENLFHFQAVITLFDNPENEGTQLATMLYHNRHKSSDFLAKLASAYAHFLLENIKIEDTLTAAVNQIILEITNRFYQDDLRLNKLLQKSGYAEDYIRARFKQVTGKTPHSFLTEIRIKHALFLIDIYANTLSLQEIARQCGYTDYIYFSKKFKTMQGISPREYKKALQTP